MKKQVLFLLCFSNLCFAGPLEIRDRAGLLTATDRGVIEQAASRSPFTIHLLTESSTRDLGAWEQQVARAVTGSDVLAIGIEKAHHWTTIKAGGSTGIPTGNGIRLGDAGNAFFRQGNFGAGVDAIIVHAGQMRAVAPVIVDVPIGGGATPIVVQPNVSVAPLIYEGPGAWFWILMAGLVLGVISWFVVKRRRLNRTLREAEQERDEARADRVIHEDVNSIGVDRRPEPPRAAVPVRAPAPYRYRPSVSPSRPPASVPAPQPAPQTVQQQVVVQSDRGGGSDFLTGVLVGEALNRHEPVREVVREVPRYDPPAPTPSTSSWSSDSDSSSSSSDTSSWDSGNSSSGSDSGSSGGGGDTSGW